MITEILEYEDGRIKITPEAFTIPELHAIIMKHGDDAEKYLSYVRSWASPKSAYKNIPREERDEAILYDIKDIFGDFDEKDELVAPAIERMKSQWETANTLAADEMEEELHRWRKYLRETPMGGEEMKNRLTVVAQFEKAAQIAVNLRKIADEEVGTKLKGNNELGEY